MIQVYQGTLIPADCILVEGEIGGLTINEKLMTGHDEKIKIVTYNDALDNPLKRQHPFMLSHSFVENGSGKALVCAVGARA